MPERTDRQSERESAPLIMGTVTAPVSPTQVPRETRRYPELDGHRGVAVVAIVVFDVYQFCNVDHFLYRGTPAYTVLNSLDAMVPWLFVLSAFLLFEPIAQAIIDGRRPISARRFLTRRAIKLLPAYYVAVGIVWFPRQQGLPGDWRDLLEHLTFTQVFDPKRIFYTIGPAWAVSVLVFFYLLLIIVSALLSRMCQHLTTRRSRVAALATSVSALAAISLGWKAWSFSEQHRTTTGSFTTWFGPTANLDIFAVGMAVAILVGALDGTRPLGHRSRTGLRAAAVALLLVAFASRHAGSWTSVYFPSLCALGFGALVAAAVLGPSDDVRARSLSWRPLLWLGTISYSVYLWHEPIMLALHGHHALIHQSYRAFVPDAAIVVVASILLGLLSYWLIERPTSQLVEIIGRNDDIDLRNDHHHQRQREKFRSANPSNLFSRAKLSTARGHSGSRKTQVRRGGTRGVG